MKAMMEHVEVAGDDAEQVVEIMRDAAGKLPDGFHLLRLTKLLLGRAPLRQVARNFGKAQQFAGSVANCIDDHAGPKGASVLPDAPPLHLELSCLRSSRKRHAWNVFAPIFLSIEAS